MDTYNVVEQFHKEMIDPSCDARAESIVALALEEGLSFEDMHIVCDNFFHRPNSKDLFKTLLREDALKHKIIQLHLSRSGMYGPLPEGVIHQPGGADKHVSYAYEMAAEYRINKNKEQDARTFFQPFDEEFFRVKVQIEIEESRMLQGFGSGILNEYFMKFWGLPSSIPNHFIVPFMQFLPYSGKIAGDLNLTSEGLELLLKEPIRIKKVASKVTDMRSMFFQEPGMQQCGIDMVCGEEFMEDYTVLECIIGPLENSQICDYLEGGRRFLFLQTFYDFFIPVDADIATVIEVSIHQSNMNIEEGNESVLGYSSVLTI